MENDVEIHWTTTFSEWRFTLNDDGRTKELYFELPDEIRRVWLASEETFVETRLRAIGVKERFFKKVSVYGKRDNHLIFFILKLDLESIRNAREQIQS
jgi:hypothetical protein